MKHFCNPVNLEYRYQFFEQPGSGLCRLCRESADPSLIRFRGQFYLFPSVCGGFFTSDDLTDWTFHQFLGEMPVLDYAPDIRPVGDYLYFCASRRGEACSFWRTKDPEKEAFEEIKGAIEFWDPALFLDDDGRMYLYDGCSNLDPLYGVELDPKTMLPLSEKHVMFDSHIECRGYERIGDDHVDALTPEEREAKIQDLLAAIPGDEKGAQENLLRNLHNGRPYIEGAWMTKRNGKYYFHYAIPGTEYNTYGNGIYESDKPLGPFVPAKNNPMSYEPGGFITGAGHGSTVLNDDGRYWHIASMRISKNHMFERRLGIWKVGFDEDDNMFCDQNFGDWPQNIEKPAFAGPDYMLLSYGASVHASSGTGAELVTNEDIRNWWQADGADEKPVLTVDLGKVKDIRGIQINFADGVLERPMPEKAFVGDGRGFEVRTEPTRWLLEGSADGAAFEVIADRSNADTDLSHEYLPFEDGISYRFLKLTILAVPYGQAPAVSGIRVFGLGEGELPAVAKNVSASVDENGMDMTVRFDKGDAIGANILWGFAPDRLYHSCLTYGLSERHIGALVAGEPVFIRVDTFNEKGVTAGEVICVR